MTRGDLPPGVQCCQSVHAALEFALAHPSLLRDWHGVSNTLALLAARDELALAWLCQDATFPACRVADGRAWPGRRWLTALVIAAATQLAAGLRHARFHEPDLGGALTAVAFEPAAEPLLRHLPTALSRRREVMTT